MEVFTRLDAVAKDLVGELCVWFWGSGVCMLAIPGALVWSGWGTLVAGCRRH